MTEYRVKRQRIALRDWPGKHPEPSAVEVSAFQDLQSALRDFCDHVLSGHEWVLVERDYNSGVCGGIAVYNKSMDDLT